MKRIAAFFTAAAVLIAAMFFSSCGMGGSGSAEDMSSSSEALPKLRIAGMIYEPYFFKNVDGHFDGIDVEMAVEACSRIGYEPEFLVIDTGTLFSVLKNGGADCVWSCVSMDKYGDLFQWAGPYLYSQRVIMVKNTSEIKILQELDGKKIAVQFGSASEDIILKKEGTEGFPTLKQISVFESLGEVFTALKKDYVDAAAGQEAALGVYADEYPGEFRYLDMSIQCERLGVAFNKNANDELVNKLGEVLKQMQEDGFTAGIIQKYGLDIDRNVYGGSEDAAD